MRPSLSLNAPMIAARQAGKSSADGGIVGGCKQCSVHEHAAYMRMCSTMLVVELCTAFGRRESVFYILMHLNEKCTMCGVHAGAIGGAQEKLSTTSKRLFLSLGS